MMASQHALAFLTGTACGGGNMSRSSALATANKTQPCADHANSKHECRMAFVWPSDNCVLTKKGYNGKSGAFKMKLAMDATRILRERPDSVGIPHHSNPIM